MIDQFRVDMAFLLLTRDRGFQQCSVKFAWADASPQGGFDFLLWKHRWVFAKDLLRAAKAMADLTMSVGGALGDNKAHEVPLSLAGERIAANAVLSSTVHEHLCVFIGKMFSGLRKAE